jgi:enamine deaminase RidA (YjgF/YER057c/UK114 family)
LELIIPIGCQVQRCKLEYTISKVTLSSPPLQTIYASGSVPLNPETMKVVEGDINVQATQMFKNIKGVMDEAGTDTSRVLKTTVCSAVTF